MPRRLDRLSAKSIAAKRAPRYYADGGALYLQISKFHTKSWVFRFARGGKSREMGLGALQPIGLAEARTRAQACRALLLDGVDPIEARDQRKQAAAASIAKTMTFSECAAAYIKSHRAKWSDGKHAAQWTSTLNTYVDPVFGGLNVADIDTGLVLKVLEPIWATKTETATRLRHRIEAVLDYAAVRGYRSGDNPARLKGHLDKLLPHIPKQRRVKHHAALPFDEVGQFVRELQQQEGIAARALELAILTATRTGEVIGATWSEFDLDAAVWTIPGARMKAGAEHRVPLPARAVEILGTLHRVHGNPHVFPGAREGKPLSNMAMAQLLERMERADLTVHGFRSTFRDWTSERTSYPREVCEQALAHTIGDAVEAAYRRGDLFEKWRRLMAEWAKHCNTVQPAGKVLRLQTGTHVPQP